MADLQLPLNARFGSTRPRPITPSLNSNSNSSSNTATPTSNTPISKSSFIVPQSSISKKKPPGLSIQKSLKPLINPSDSPNSKEYGGGYTPRSNLSGAEQLRQDIERLQLSSRSSSERSLDSTSQSSIPSTPTSQNDVVPTTAPGEKKKGVNGNGEVKRKKVTKDKDGLDLVKDEDLEILKDLGSGNGGTVTKVFNKKRNCIMARKLIMVDTKPSVRKQILRELQIMNDCNSPYIVGYYGCFPVSIHVAIVMELMDAGSLDRIYRAHGPVPITIVGKVAEAVLRGLIYLYDTHRIIHRDIKPSNILANTNGEIKICDFGVSGELINSIANTFVGTSTYMSPERIQGSQYSIKSDIWSLGISLIELAQGRFPFSDSPDSDSEEYDPDPTLPLSTQRPNLDSKPRTQGGKKKNGVSQRPAGHQMSILDLLQHIVNEPAPKLNGFKKTKFPSQAEWFVEKCLEKDPGKRCNPRELLASEWIQGSKVTPEELRLWATEVASE